MEIRESEIPDLIRRGKDQEAIQSIYKNVLPNVRKFVRNNLGKEDDAYDLFQDAIMVFYQRVMENKFDTQYNVYGFVYKICVYRWINKATREKLQFREELPEIEVTPPTSWFSDKSSEEEGSLLKELFSSIGEKCLELLTYTIYKDLPFEDIALRMNFPTDVAARMQHHRCKEKLQKEIKDNPILLTHLRSL